MVYIVENNGVYGLTKGQFSATAEQGLDAEEPGHQPVHAGRYRLEALVGNATFVARSFAGDPKQVKELIKAALSHNGIAVLDIISPCVTFNNQDTAMHSYAWGKDHEVALHELSYVPPAEEIMVDYGEGEAKEVTMHDGSMVMLQEAGAGLRSHRPGRSHAHAGRSQRQALADHRLDLHRTRTAIPAGYLQPARDAAQPPAGKPHPTCTGDDTAGERLNVLVADVVKKMGAVLHTAPIYFASVSGTPALFNPLPA